MGDIPGLLILCVATVFAMFWVHYRLRTHKTSTRVWTGGILFVMGLAFGWAMAYVYAEASGLQQLLIFISSVGLVHVPAAVILQLKHWQHSETD